MQAHDNTTTCTVVNNFVIDLFYGAGRFSFNNTFILDLVAYKVSWISDLQSCQEEF